MSGSYFHVPRGCKHLRAQSPKEIPGIFFNDLLKDFRSIIYVYFDYLQKPNWFDIFKKRFGLEGEKQISIVDLGKVYDLSKERIHQLLLAMTYQIRRLLEGYELEKPRIRCDATKFQFKNFKNDISASKIIVYSKVRKIINKYLKDIPDYSDPYVDLLMFIYGFKCSNYDGVRFYYKGKLKTLINRIKTFKMFMSKQALPVFEEDLLRKLKINKDELSFFLSFMNVIIQKNEKGIFYLVDIKDLSTTYLKVYRLLYETGRPMHFLEIKNMLAERGCDVSIHKAVLKKELICIGRSGKWALRDWAIETSTISELLFRILKRTGRPVSIQDLYCKLNKVREVDLNSVRSFLSVDKRFVQYKDGTFGLKKWCLPNQKARKKRTSHRQLKEDQIIDRIIEILKENSKMLLKDVVNKLAMEGYNRITVYNTINKRNHLFVKEDYLNKEKCICLVN